MCVSVCSFEKDDHTDRSSASVKKRRKHSIKRVCAGACVGGLGCRWDEIFDINHNSGKECSRLSVGPALLNMFKKENGMVDIDKRQRVMVTCQGDVKSNKYPDGKYGNSSTKKIFFIYSRIGSKMIIIN